MDTISEMSKSYTSSENRPEWLPNVDKKLTAKRHEGLMCMQNLKHFATINYPAMSEVYRMVDGAYGEKQEFYIQMLDTAFER